MLTQHPRPPFEMEGGTSFHFLDPSPDEALAAARKSVGDFDIRIGGGVQTVGRFLKADLVNDRHLVVTPIVTGRGERLWDGLEGVPERVDVESVASPSGVTQLRFPRRKR